MVAMGVVAGAVGAEGLTCQLYARQGIDAPAQIESCPEGTTACISYGYTVGTDPVVQSAFGACATGTCDETRAVVQTGLDAAATDGQTVPISDWSCALCEDDDCNEVISVSAVGTSAVDTSAADTSAVDTDAVDTDAVDTGVTAPAVGTSGHSKLAPALSAVATVGLAMPLIFN